MKNLFLILLVAATGLASEYDYWNQAFWMSQTPHVRDLEGFWTGRCVNITEPNTRWPAIYGVTRVEPSANPHTWYNMQSHLSQRLEEDHYDGYTSTDLFNDSYVDAWLSDPRYWSPIYFENGSLVSGQRQTRSFFNGSEYYIVVKYARSPYATDPGSAMCYFRNRILASSTPQPTPPPVEPQPPVNPAPPVEPNPPTAPLPPSQAGSLLGNSGPVEKGYVEVESKLADQVLNRLIFINQGAQSVNITDLKLRIVGAVLTLPGKLTLEPGKEIEVKVGSSGEKIRRVEFRVSDRTSDIEIRAALID